MIGSSDRIGAELDQKFVSTVANPTQTTTGACVVFRREFRLEQKPKQASLHLFADARYVLWINGRYIDRGPARFEPISPEYDTIDVAEDLKTGDNAVAVLVTGRISNGKSRWRPLGLTAELEADKKAVFTTDDRWRWSDRTRYRQVVADWGNVYDIADARSEDGDWTQTAYDDRAWNPAVRVLPARKPFQVRTRVDDREKDLVIEPIGTSWWGPLSKRRIPPLRESQVKPSLSAELPITLTAGEELKLKFSRLVLAATDIEIDATAGSLIELTYSPQTQYICREGVQRFLTSDVHAIFDGAIRVKAGKVTFRRVTFVERLYGFSRAGSFHSSDPLLNRLWNTCVRGLELTSEDAYVDCSDRERVEWMDCDPPAFDVTRVAMEGPGHVLADPRLLESSLRRTGLTLQPDGWVKAHTCSDRFDIHAKMEDRACDWVQGARRYVESCGKTDVVREIWPAIVTQMNYFLSRRTSRGLVRVREWVVWGNPVGYQTCEGLALNAFIQKALVDAAFLGRKIREQKQATEFESAAKDLAESINKYLWDEAAGTYYAGFYDPVFARAAADYRPLPLHVENGLIEPTRHAALFALDQGVVPEARKARTIAYLLAHPPQDNSIMQYYYFWKQQYAFDDSGEDQNVLDTMRREWRDMAESPYESTFEGLHSWGSKSHGYGMFPAYFLSSYVLGVRRENDTWIIEPRLANLTKAEGNVVTERGLVSVSWERHAQGGTFKIVVPKGMRFRLRPPAGSSHGRAILNSRRFVRKGRWTETALGPGSYTGSWEE